MGQIPKSTIDECWTTDPLLETPIFPKTMSHDRFKDIWRWWHFVNNDEMDESSDRLFKIRPVYDSLVEKFNTVYAPRREISLDESIIPWRGRLEFKVYNASKIIKYEILVRVVAESKSSYTGNMKMYCGEGRKLAETILDILTPYKDKYYHVFMDNYYNSVDINETLLKHKIRSCGTIRVNRGLPHELKNNKLQRGQSIFRRKGNVLVKIWQSKREVRMISYIHSSELFESSNTD